MLSSTVCVSGCTIGVWTSVSFNANPYHGQSVKLKFERNVSGTWGIDNVTTVELFPGYDTTAVSYRTVTDGDPGLQIQGDFTTPAFTVDATAQHGHFRAKGLTANTGWNVYVLSGMDYATSTEVLAVYLAIDDFHDYQIPVYGFAGQSVKIKFDQINGSGLFDDIGEQRIDVPNWTLSAPGLWGAGITNGAVGVPGVDVEGNAAGTALSLAGEMITSAAFTVDANAQQLSLRHKAVASNAAFNITVFYGAGYTQSASLTGTSNVPSSQTDWQTYQVAIASYAGQSVKIRITANNRIMFDDVGFTGSAAPGWTPEAGYGAIGVGEDASGTYVTPYGSAAGSQFRITSSIVSAGIVDTGSVYDGRSIALGYAFGPGGTGTGITVSWIPVVGGVDQSPCVPAAYSALTDGTMGYKDARFKLKASCLPRDGGGTLIQTGRWKIVMSGGGRVYAIADNVARQQLSEPFSQQAGGIDTSTGSFGWSTQDLAIAGGPLPLVLTRYYAAHSDRLGELGYRWRHSFDTTLYIGASQDPVVVLFADGGEEAFEKSGSAYVATDPRVHDALATQPDPANPGQIQYVFRTKAGMVWTFTDTGKLVTIADPSGNTISLTYDATYGLLTQVSNGVGALTFAYDAAHTYLTSVTGPGGVQVSYGYATQGSSSTTPNLVAVDLPENGRQEYVYSRHRLKRIKTRQGTNPSTAAVDVVVNTLDDYNRVSQQQDASGSYFRIDYQTDGTTPTAGVNQVRDRANQNALTKYFYDDWGRTQAVVTPTGEVTQFFYDAAGNLQKWIDGSGGQYQFAYNGSGDVTGITDPLSAQTSVTVNARHLPTEVTDATGAMTVNSYDGEGNLTRRVVDASVDSTGASNGSGPFLDLTTAWTYDAGKVTSVTRDPGGVDLMTRYVYDGDLLVATVVDPSLDASGASRGGTHLDLSTSYTYDASGRLTSETDPDGVMTLYDYSAWGRLVNVILDPSHNPDLSARAGTHLDLTSQYVYDTPGNLIIAKDPVCHAQGYAGCQTEWLYDARNLVTDKYDDLDARTTYTYDANGRMTGATVDPDDAATGYDGLNLTTAYRYDDAGRLDQTTTDPGGLDLVTAYAYDDAGRLWHEVVDPDRTGHTGLKLTTSYDYYADGKLRTKTQPDGGVWSYGYDAAGRLVLTVDPMGRATQTVYDAAGRVTRTIVDPDDAATSYVGLKLTTTYEYDGASRLTQVTNAAGERTDYVYDGAGRLWKTIVDPDDAATSHSGLKLTTTTTYTAAGRTATATDPSGYATGYEYDGAGRLDLVTEPGNRRTTYAYDENGQVILSQQLDPITDDVLAASATAYDAVGRVTHSIVDPDRSPYTGMKLDTASTYDRAGRLRTITDPRGYTSTYDYDGANRRWKIKDAANPQGTVTLLYDDASRPSSVENARGYATTYAYALSPTTGLGWVTTVTDPLNRVKTTTANVAGQIAQVVDPNGNQLNYGHDPAGRLHTISDANFGTYVTYNRDGLGRTTSVVNANGSVGYSYDDAGRIDQITSPQGTVGYASAPNGRRATMTLPAVGGGSPRVVTYAYDPATDDLVSVTDWTSATTDFTYDGRGLPYQVLRPNGITTTYGYDAALRLTGISHFGINTGTYLAEYGYQYDLDGNRTRLDVTGSAVTNGYETYGYDELDRLTDYRDLSGSSSSYAYDANGNRTSVDDGTITTAYEYDAADQLQKIDGVDVFDYDGNGNRIGYGTNSYSYDWANRLTAASVGGTSASYAYLGDGSRASKSVGSGTPVTTDYLWDRQGGLPQLLDDGTTGVVRASGLLAEIDNSTSDHAWALRDALGSVRARVDDAASVVDTEDWDVWGNAVSGSAGLFGWDGEQSDPETGLTFLRARYYSPVFGQFLSPDPKGPNRLDMLSYDPYLFSNDSPATRSDPSGLSSVGGIAGGFWYMAWALECALNGECRFGRRHGGSRGLAGLSGQETGEGQSPQRGDGGPPTIATPSEYALDSCASGTCTPTAEAASDCAFGAPCDRFRPNSDNNIGIECRGINGKGSDRWAYENTSLMDYIDQCGVDEMLKQDGVEKLILDAGPDLAQEVVDREQGILEGVDDFYRTDLARYGTLIWIGGTLYIVSAGLWGMISQKASVEVYKNNCSGHGVVKFRVTGYDVSQWQERAEENGLNPGHFGQPWGWSPNTGFTDPDLYDNDPELKIRPQLGDPGGFASCPYGPFPS